MIAGAGGSNGHRRLGRSIFVVIVAFVGDRIYVCMFSRSGLLSDDPVIVQNRPLEDNGVGAIQGFNVFSFIADIQIISLVHRRERYLNMSSLSFLPEVGRSCKLTTRQPMC